MEIIRPIIKIYHDEEIELNYKKTLDYYNGKYSVTVNEKDIFYCSEEEVVNRLNDFAEKSINNISDKIDINIWFKEFNNLYPWVEKLGKHNLFNKEKIILAIEKYSEKINIAVGLYNIIYRAIPFSINHDDMNEYFEIFKNKVCITYYAKLIREIKKSLDKKIFDVKLIEDLFGTLFNSNY